MNVDRVSNRRADRIRAIFTEFRKRLAADPDSVVCTIYMLKCRPRLSLQLLMATCPRCFGALTDNHKCPRGTFSRITDAVSTVGIGGIAGALLVFVVEERPVGALVLAAAALGAVLAVAIRQAVSGRIS